MRRNYLASSGIVFIGWMLLALAARAQTAPAEINFVFGSDTSTGGIAVGEPEILFGADDVEMYTRPDGTASRIMDDDLRRRLSDWYGDPLRLTWWMQGGSIYQFAANTNFPLPSTMPLHLMKRHHGDAMARHGDELTFHYHSWVWSDYDGDGTYYWNQARSFEEVRDDFDRTVAQYLLEEEVYPVSFRTGWHYLDNAWQARLDELLPFSMHNASPYRGHDAVEPLDNLYDWSRAPLDFVPFKPHPDDYQRPGGTRGWNVRSAYLRVLREQLIREIFAAAQDGRSQVVCLWSHLAEPDFVEQIEHAVALIRKIAAEYPDVPFRYTTAIDAMQRWLQTRDHTAPALTIDEVERGDGIVLRIASDEPLFQPAPFVALKDRYERYHELPLRAVGARQWETTRAFARDAAAKIGVAAVDSSGNLATHIRRYVPDDLYLDNRDASYEEREGAWATGPVAGVDQVWGVDYRVATLRAGDEAAVRWRPEITGEATYNVFVRVPAIVEPAAGLRVAVRVGGEEVDAAHLEGPLPTAEWLYAGTAHLRPGDDVAVELRSAGPAAGTARMVVDAVRLSALVRDRQLRLDARRLDAGDVVRGDTVRLAMRLRNLGNEPLTIRRLYTGTDVLWTGLATPLVLAGQAAVDLPLYVHAAAVGELRDTLYIESDDPLEPLVRVPFQARALAYFVVVDNDDASGYAEEGPWQQSVTQAFGATSRYAAIAGAPEATATFTGTVSRPGVYDLSVIVPRSVNSALRARYRFQAGDTPPDTVVINQNDGSGGWRSLGLYRLEAGAAFRLDVTRADQDQSGRVLRADAARLALVGERLRSIIVDDADASAYVEEGDWSESVAQAHGSTSRFAPTHATARAVFQARAEADGLHAVRFIVPTTENASRRARYRIRRNGPAVDSVFVDQNEGSGAWRLLGSYLLARGDVLEVEVSQAGPGEGHRVLRADAIRLDFAGDASTGVHRDVPRAVPALSAPYPNPVQATATFTYDVTRPGPVRIVLYDALGREVAALVDGPVAAGRHVVRFDAGGLVSGVYFCRLEAGGQAVTRTWVVLR